jgi:hypothetical protein
MPQYIHDNKIDSCSISLLPLLIRICRYFLPARIDILLQSPRRQASPAPLSPGARTIQLAPSFNMQRGISSSRSHALFTNAPIPWPIFSKASSEALLPSRLLFPAMPVSTVSQPLTRRIALLTPTYRLRRLRDSSLAVSTLACRLFCFFRCCRCHQHRRRVHQ